MQQQRIIYLDVLRSLAIISITLNHAVNRSYEVYSNQMKEFNSIPVVQTILKTFFCTFSRLGVPLFLMITGALLLSRDYTKDYKFIKHNFLRLFITTEIWLAIMFWYLQISPDSILHTRGLMVCMVRFIMTLLFINPVSFENMWYMYMILCAYFMIPFLSLGIRNLKPLYFIIPCAIVLFCSFLLTDINYFFHTLEYKFTFHTELQSGNIFSMFVVLMLLGHFSANGGLQKIPTALIVLFLLVSFILYNIFQFWIFSSKFDGVVGCGYHSIFPVLAAVPLFELIRRKESSFDHRILRPCITELSIISFGIYFIHICIVAGANTMINHFNLPITHFNSLIVLEFVSFFGSILIIELFKRFKWMSKYLFGIR